MSRLSHFTLMALLLVPALALAETRQTALAALKVLPKDAADNLVSIHSFEGTPMPPRWHFMVHDPKQPNGVHEYVVSDGEIVASRNVSQFADELKPTDVIGAESVKVDTDRVVKLAEKFAQTNKEKAVAFDYELKKDGEGAVPLWHITCMDENGESIGTLVLTATKAGIVSHDGFAKIPGADEKPQAPREERRPEVRRAEPARRPPPPTPPRGNFFKRVFGGGNSASQ
jgi:hypothetical protein